MIAGVICGALGLLLIIFAILICRYLGPGPPPHHICHPYLQVFGPWTFSLSYSPSSSAGIWFLGLLLIIFAILICRYLGPGPPPHHIRHTHLQVFGPWASSSSYLPSSSAGTWALGFLLIIFAILICRYLGPGHSPRNFCHPHLRVFGPWASSSSFSPSSYAGI